MVGLGFGLAPSARAQGTDAAAGETVYRTYCIACHTIGGGNLIGPDLKGVTQLRSREWLERWIRTPDQVLASGDSIATALLHEFREVPMPNLQLKADQVTAVLAYLEAAEASGATAAISAAAAPMLPGNVEAGKNYFTGADRLQNGGPSCMACHSVVGIGALGGGNLGPDLTDVSARYGGVAGLNAFLVGIPTPVMRSIWTIQPLTDQERADVVAFLGQAPVAQRPAQAIWQLAGLALVGLAVLLGIAGMVWRGRLRDGVRRPMVMSQRQARG